MKPRPRFGGRGWPPGLHHVQRTSPLMNRRCHRTPAWMADLDDITMGKYLFTHPLPVHVKPIAAVQISDREYTRIARDAGMPARGATVLQNQTGIRGGPRSAR